VVFGWRKLQNRRERASRVGLDPRPSPSGESHREPGIRKAGNRRVRWTLVELAWRWRRSQPDSTLSPWSQRRFGAGTTRARTIGMVALARQWVIAVGKNREPGEVPAGAVLVPWGKRLKGRQPAQAWPA
jgi:transposase